MQKRINVLVNCPNPKDATSLYRGMGPLCELQRKYPQINSLIVEEYSWMTFAMADVFFLQRPYTSKHLDMVNLAKDNRLPVWVDYDDDLFSVPVSNPAYPVYSNMAVQKTIASIIATADLVTVSTPFLKRQLEKGPMPLNKNIRVIPNALNERILDYRQAPSGERRKLVLWRGSSTHHKDLHHYLGPIVNAVNSDSTWGWMFQGDKPWFLFERLGSNAIFAESIDPIQYFKAMHEVRPPYMMVPLHDSEFNRSKSNIAWLEGAFFGAMSLAPDWEEWQRPGVLNYKDQKDFADKLAAIMRGDFDPNARSAESWEFVRENLLLSKVNELRMDALRDLLG